MSAPYKIDAKILAVAPWGGNKRGLAARIVQSLGPHDFYLEPFAGGCAILPRKRPCEREFINDLNPAAANVLRCIRDQQPILSRILGATPFDKKVFEWAREIVAAAKLDATSADVGIASQQLAAWWMGANGYAGTTVKAWFAQRFSKTGGDPAVRWNSFRSSLPALSARLKGVTITCQDWCRVFDAKYHDQDGVAIYCDPPYFSKKFKYAHDFGPNDHVALAYQLNCFRRARVVVSYYDDELIPTLYPSERWERIEVSVSKASANARAGAKKTSATELLLVNRRT